MSELRENTKTASDMQEIFFCEIRSRRKYTRHAVNPIYGSRSDIPGVRIEVIKILGRSNWGERVPKAIPSFHEFDTEGKMELYLFKFSTV